MSINLKKGSSLNLTKKEPSLKKAIIGLSWEFASNPLDLDASVFMVGDNGKLIGEEYLVFYNNLKSPDGAIKHTGDNRTGKGDGDDEMIAFNMDNVNPDVKEIIIYVSIHDAAARKHNFGMLKDASIRLMDAERDNLEILKYDLDAENGTDTEVIFGKISKDSSNEWHFHAVGAGSTAGFEETVSKYI